MTPGRWRGWLRGRGRPTASAAGPAAPGGGAGGGQAPGPGHSSGGGDGAALVAGDIFTPGRAGGQGVLVWEGAVAAPDSPLAWHSATPVEVFFHTGHHRATQELASEFTRQLDRQLSALSLLSAERLLEGIRAYRTQGRQPTSKATRRARDTFMDKVVDDLRRVHQLSREDARARAAEVDRALVVLHEPDQLLAGPGGPATTGPQPGYPSLGHGQVNSSVGSQNKPMVAVLEQAALQVPPGAAFPGAPAGARGADRLPRPGPGPAPRPGGPGAPHPGPGERHQPPGATVDTQPRRRHHRHRPRPLAPTTRAGAETRPDPPGHPGPTARPGPARGTHRGRPLPHHQPARGLLPPPAYRRRARTTTPDGPAVAAADPRGGPGQDHHPAAPHPTPDPHQKTPTQPRPGPLAAGASRVRGWQPSW
ncbi:polymorphic toxin type 15 domain-containing protein [Actinomyces wuliandei]|uniref:polymorphic toxin type 15 domain-containing protein n=1 Tax=Actinomyces wuliandei TaxID=2057743 RepID=UPI000FDB1BC3|nr:polymorphic toxin type 15 domain-containing protein [Actinomyces wuliandei]